MTTWLDFIDSVSPIKRTFTTPPALEQLIHIQTVIRAHGVDLMVRLDKPSAILREEVKMKATLGLVDLEFSFAGAESLHLQAAMLAENRGCSIVLSNHKLVLHDAKGGALLEIVGDSAPSVSVVFPSH